MAPAVLIVEDEKILGDSIVTYLERHGYTATIARSGTDGIRLAEEGTPDLAVVDIRLPGVEGLEVLRRLRETCPGTEVVMMTAHASVASAVEAMKRGAFDYLTKPLDLEELRVVLEKALGHQRMRQQLSYLKARADAEAGVGQLVGESPAMEALRAEVQRVARLEAPGSAGPTVLVLGETGAGKELVARAIHAESPRAAGPFVEINCAAIPSTLLEAELFGYERGAYTDARTAKAGLFEAADGGTLFLDEIGHMDPALQVKLLRAIEEKAVRRVGGLRTRTVNVRIVAATNRDLEAAIAEGAFRADLYYRIKVLTITVPPLRVRGDDIPRLADHFVARFAREYGLPPKEIAPDAVVALRGYAWPGNVRELRHVIERAVLVGSGAWIMTADLGLPGRKSEADVAIQPGGRVAVDFATGGIALEEVERDLIVAALEAAAWNRVRAAQLLGISKDTLRYRMEKFQLRPPPSGDGKPSG